MPAAVAICANNVNVVLGATVSVSAQRQSEDLRLLERTKQGGGTITLVGPYTGAADTTVEVEVLSGTGTELRASAPVLTGVGSGALEVLALDPAAVPETWTVRLVAAGTPARSAELAFFGVTLRAAIAGAVGNDLTLEVSRDLTTTETAYSLLSAMAAGESEHQGQQWDWGAPAGSTGEIPRTAPRLMLQGHSQVFRHWKTWDAGAWTYHIDPAPADAVGAGTRVLSVSGGYTATLSDGVSDEIYAAVTIYDLLTQVAVRSTLVEVDGVVAEDLAPGGMAVTDIPLRTDAYADPVDAEINSPYGAQRLDAIAVDADAPTEILSIKRLASGNWSVTGSISGTLPEARTGVAYSQSAAPAGFVIPVAEIPAADQAEITITPTWVARGDDEQLPALCTEAELGPAAAPKSVTFVYTRRPEAACTCDGIAIPPIQYSCLDPGAGEAEMSDLPAALQTRLESLMSWRSTFAAAQTQFGPDVRSDSYEITFGDQLVEAFYEALAAIYEDTTALAEWDSAWSAAQTQAADLTGGPGIVADLRQRGETVTILPAAGRVAVSAQSGWIANPHTEILYLITAGGGQYTFTPRWPAADDAAWPAVGASADIEVQPNPADTAVTFEVYAERALSADAVITTDAAVTTAIRPWLARMDYVRGLAGIAPTFDSASSIEAGNCWQDHLDESYWWVDDSGEYLPAFNGYSYASVRRINGVATPTHEFGFGLAISCPDLLLEGDRFTLAIGGATADGYLPGDLFRLPIVAAAPAAFGGGGDPDTVQTWAIRGSVSGDQADWLWDPDDPTDYTAGLVDLRLVAGGLDYQAGDAWTIAVEGGEYRWRRDGGSWSSEDLYGVAPDLGDGLSLSIAEGAAPSFAADDTWSFAAFATYGPEQLRAPVDGRGLSWEGASQQIDLDLGAVQPVEAVLLALHTLPVAAAIAIAGGDAAVGEWSLAPEWRAGPILALLPAGTTARYLRVTLTDYGAGASIGWLWAGVPWQPAIGPSSMSRSANWSLLMTDGRNPGAIYRGAGIGGTWSWSLDAGAPLPDGDREDIEALLGYIAEQGRQAVCLIPDTSDLSRATIAQLDADSTSIEEHIDWRIEGERVVSVDLAWRGWIE
jgi:hypothetical protein